MGTKFIQGTLDATLLKENGVELSTKYLQKTAADGSYASMAWVEDALTQYAKNSDVVNRTGSQWGIQGDKEWMGTMHFNGDALLAYGHSQFKGKTDFSGETIFYGKLSNQKFFQNNGIVAGGVIDLNPEDTCVVFPFYMNDLAYLNAKGGSCTITGATQITNTGGDGYSTLFDGTSSTMYLTLNDVNDEVIILIKAHQNFYYHTKLGISFGSSYWRAKNIKIEMGYATEIGGDPADDAWVTRVDLTDYEYGVLRRDCNGPQITSNSAWNTIRITLTNFNNTTPRINGIFVVNYNSEGLNTTLLGKKGGYMYGSVDPYKTDEYSLGSATNRWHNTHSQCVFTDYLVPSQGWTGLIGDSNRPFHSLYVSNIYENGTKLTEKYATKTDLISKQDKLTAGDNITILEDGTISANISAEDVGVQVDSALSTTSENPVQNKVITAALNSKADSSAIPTKLSELTNDDNYLKTSSTVYPAIVKLPLTSFSLNTTLGTDGTPGVGTNRITTTDYFDIQTSSECRITYISCSRRNTSYTPLLILCEYDVNKKLLQRRSGLAINKEITLLDGTRFVKFTCYASGDAANVADIFYDFKIYRNYQSARYITCYEDWWNPSKGTTRPAVNWYFNGDFDLRMPHPSALVTSRTNEPVTKVVREALAQQPFAKYLWHDVLAFNRFNSPKYEVTTDGVTWTEATLPTALFACKEFNSVAILTKASGTNICGVRWTWTLTSSGLQSSSAEFFAIGRNWVSSTEEAAPRYVIERGNDLTNLTKVFDQVITDPNSPATPIFLFPEDGNYLSNNNYLRLTISKAPNTETRLNLSTIKLLTNRWGDQGKGSEYEHPYSWIADGSVTMMKDFNVPGQATFTGNVLAANNLNVTGEITASNNKVKINQDIVQLQQNTTIQKGIINNHPESANRTMLAYYVNGLSGFTNRGGNILLRNATKSSSSWVDQLFDGYTDYFQYRLTNKTDVVEFILQLPKEYTWTNTIGIGFGTGSYWGCKSIKTELGYISTTSTNYKVAPTEDNWTTINSEITWKTLETKTFTTAPDVYTVADSGPTAGDSSSKPFNYMRITLTDFVTTSPRIAGIWVNSAGDKGLAESYLTRDGSVGLYGDLLPDLNDKVRLGSSSNYWSAIWTNNLRASYIWPRGGNNSGQIGTPETQFWNVAARTFYENTVKLEDKYATKTEIDILKAFTLEGGVELSTASGYYWTFSDSNKVNLYYTPTEPGDAVNKDYVDNNFISNNGSGLKTINGQSLVGTGDITIEGGTSRRDLVISTEAYNILSPDNYIVRPYQENITGYTFTINDHPELYENKLLEYCGEISLGASEVTLTIDSNIISDLRWNTNYNITQINSHTLQLEPKNTYMFSVSNSQSTTGIWFGMIYNVPNPMLSTTTITMNGQTASWTPVIGFENEIIEYDVYVGAISNMVLVGTTTSNTMDLSANITTTGTIYKIKVVAKSIYYNNSTTELSYTYSA